MDSPRASTAFAAALDLKAVLALLASPLLGCASPEPLSAGPVQRSPEPRFSPPELARAAPKTHNSMILELAFGALADEIERDAGEAVPVVVERTAARVTAPGQVEADTHGRDARIVRPLARMLVDRSGLEERLAVEQIADCRVVVADGSPSTEAIEWTASSSSPAVTPDGEWALVCFVVKRRWEVHSGAATCLLHFVDGAWTVHWCQLVHYA